MGRLDQYAKEIFDTETPIVTRGAAVWQPPSEMSLTEVRLDGRIFVRDPALLATLPHPWADAGTSDEIVFESKMQGDHVDLLASERACLRRQARQVQRMEDPGAAWDADLPLWMLASRVPRSLRQRRTFRKIGDGCYRVETGSYQWIAANELPLEEELIPFLIARTGSALDEFGRWVRGRRSPDWISRMVEYLPMSIAVHDEMLRFALEKPEDEAMRARQEATARVYLELTPKVKAEAIAGAVAEAVRETAERTHREDARAVLRRVLALRKLALAPEDEARIEACADTATLDRWHDQAMVASTAAEALH